MAKQTRCHARVLRSWRSSAPQLLFSSIDSTIVGISCVMYSLTPAKPRPPLLNTSGAAGDSSPEWELLVDGTGSRGG